MYPYFPLQTPARLDFALFYFDVYGGKHLFVAISADFDYIDNMV
jgi:hypothetical protein